METIDKKLAEIIDRSNSVEDPDSLGYFDSAEHLTGLGFVACQAYMTAVYGVLRVEQLKALSYGPMHQRGKSIAQIVNDAANYWKHNNSWSLDKSPRQRKRIENTFNEVGFPVGTEYPLTEYPLSGVLTELATPYAVRLALQFIWTTTSSRPSGRRAMNSVGVTRHLLTMH